MRVASRQSVDAAELLLAERAWSIHSHRVKVSPVRILRELAFSRFSPYGTGTSWESDFAQSSAVTLWVRNNSSRLATSGKRCFNCSSMAAATSILATLPGVCVSCSFTPAYRGLRGSVISRIATLYRRQLHFLRISSRSACSAGSLGVSGVISKSRPFSSMRS